MSGWLWLLVPLSYLVGTFPSAALAARANGIDIRQAGSGNPGASNVTRNLGWKWGASVMMLDALKGAVPTEVGLYFGDRAWAYVLLTAAILGHMFPFWRGLRGGKGVATAGGGFFVLAPIATLVGLLIWVIVSRVSGKASIASLALIALAPVAMWLTSGHLWELFAAGGISLLIAIRHANNIKQLLRRSEPSLSQQPNKIGTRKGA